jgi:hypothetical protein
VANFFILKQLIFPNEVFCFSDHWTDWLRMNA